VYNRPGTRQHAHAGFLMGLGLQGHLLALANTDLYRYMSQGHDVTMMAVLLGMAAARRGSMHAPIAKMLCLHIPALHPPTFTELELEVPWLGLGLGLGLGSGSGSGLGLGLAANPNPNPDPNQVPAVVQTAALLGVGMLYQGSAHRLMTEVL
jgi:anaphase-promoting complex subunit 1